MNSEINAFNGEIISNRQWDGKLRKIINIVMLRKEIFPSFQREQKSSNHEIKIKTWQKFKKQQNLMKKFYSRLEDFALELN